MSDRKLSPGKFVWFEHVSKDASKAQEFYGEVLGWKVKPFPMGDFAYEMILTGESWDTMIGGYPPAGSNHHASHWIATVSLEDVDAAANAAVANGGMVLDAPSEIPGVGRRARIADPQGAELALLTDARGDKPDTPAVSGNWLWNELHTSEPASALSFYEKVVGFSHRTMDMGPGNQYHILSRDGVDRGGITGHLRAGAPPHWLPYVAVDDVDATIARAKQRGATIPMAPEDIPGIGRFGVLQDPTGAVLAVMKPLPMEKQP
ncbi:MAG TPA: VOC family protein [Bryobacteraceae bacterium]|jgi:hypothetical protein|nr:VOC family protein [Bryobacteraceae bacterium]